MTVESLYQGSHSIPALTQKIPLFIAVLYRSFPHRARSLPIVIAHCCSFPPKAAGFRQLPLFADLYHSLPIFTAQCRRNPLDAANFRSFPHGPRTAPARPLFFVQKWPFWATISTSYTQRPPQDESEQGIKVIYTVLSHGSYTYLVVVPLPPPLYMMSSLLHCGLSFVAQLRRTASCDHDH